MLPWCLIATVQNSIRSNEPDVHVLMRSSTVIFTISLMSAVMVSTQEMQSFDNPTDLYLEKSH